jgi:glycosyltransferase involved in cell wall biosynthesis
LFARSISGGTFSYEETIALLRTTRGFSAAGTASMALNFDEKTLRGLLMLARIVFSQQLRPEDSAEALEIYEVVASVSTKVFRQIDWIPFVLLSVQLRDTNTAVAVLSESSFNEQDAVEPALLLCNILRKQALESGQVPDPRYFLVPLNNHLKAIGLEPIGIKPGAPSGFLSLDTGVLNSFVAKGPKISVLMTTYNPDETFDIAVQSVLGQSWRNLELIIIDDCSSDDLFAKVKQYEQRDSRVRILRTAANGGTYAAKNLGLSQATGEFVTCHDSDDWSHPRKLELQMEAITASASLSVLSHWIRCNADLEFKAFSSKGFLCYENLSSLLFRRQPVLDLVGYFDNVRNGADSEFKKRLDRASGQPTLVTEKVPVSFGLLHGRSLTNNSLGLGWFSPERREYRMAASHWHYKLEKAAKGYRLERNPAVRPFFVRKSLLPDRGQHSDANPHYDVIIMSDFRMVGGNTLSSIEELKAQSRAGLKTAICQVDSFRKGIFAREYYPRAVHELLHDGAVDHIDLASNVTATVMNIRYPAVFQFSQGLMTNIKADTIQIIANQPPAEADSRDRRYDVSVCIANIREIFGTDPKWLPIGPSVRDALDDVPRDLMSPTDWFNIIDVDEWAAPRNKFVGNRPVIGRHGRDDKSKWPETAKALYGAYPDEGRYDVRVLGGTQAVQTAGFSIPSNWHVLPFNSVQPVDFLPTIDFFVYFHHSQRIEAFGRTVIEAMASGAVAILPESFRPLIGDGAIYCRPEEVRSVVDRYYADYALYRTQSQKGERFVRENFGYEMHLGRLARLGVQTAKA